MPVRVSVGGLQDRQQLPPYSPGQSCDRHGTLIDAQQLRMQQLQQAYVVDVLYESSPYGASCTLTWTF